MPLHDELSALAAELEAEIRANVATALAEDVGDGDITAALVPAAARVRATVVTREAGVLAGRPWAEAVFAAVDPGITADWRHRDGDPLQAGEQLVELHGPARSLLTAERTALNFLQLLCGTATAAADLAARVAGTGTRILDTRKTLPGLRRAQKYAVRAGGCHNHRIGLFDAFLLKENHIAASGSIGAAVAAARALRADAPVEVEVESMAQLDEALAAGADIIMLDNFDLAATRAAVQHTNGRARLEASGGLRAADLPALAATGVDCVSIGALTKDVRALDLSMRFTTL